MIWILLKNLSHEMKKQHREDAYLLDVGQRNISVEPSPVLFTGLPNSWPLEMSYAF